MEICKGYILIAKNIIKNEMLLNIYQLINL